MFASNSLIFVPGSRSDRFAKARDAGAGLTVIDLEDAVPTDVKDRARTAALAQVADGDAGWAVRINALTTASGIADLHALAQCDALPQTLLLPMVESAVEIEIVARVLKDRCPALIPLVETPRGLRYATEIASAPRVAAMMFGGGDFSGELGVALAWEPLAAARGAFILACAEARVPAIDVPFLGFDDADGLAEECRRARSWGFVAKAAIHPAQVAVIETAFSPTTADIAEAEDAIAAYVAGGERAIRYNGRMLEAPVIKRYRAVLARKGMINNA